MLQMSFTAAAAAAAAAAAVDSSLVKTTLSRL